MEPAEARVAFLLRIHKELYDYNSKLHKVPAEILDVPSTQAALAEIASDMRNRPRGVYDGLSREYTGLLTLAPQFLEVRLNQWPVMAKKEALENIDHSIKAINRLVVMESQLARAA
jgi:hypothetical protein